jgi:hypothetical protein
MRAARLLSIRSSSMNVRAGTLLVLGLALANGNVHAQWNYNWGGWGGGASTVQGDIAHGMGVLAAGAGQYNQQTAIANSINANTVMRINQYMFLAQQEANQRQYVRTNRRIGRANAAASETASRLRNNPDQGDIDRGDALNVLLDDLTAPELLRSSSLRLAGSELDAAVVGAIPFRNAAEAVTICLDQLTDQNRFPAFLRSAALAKEREAFVSAVHDARTQAQEQGELSSDAVARVQEAGRALYARAQSPDVVATPAERNEALNYLKGMAALAKLAANSDTLQALRELKKIKTTHVANLMGFMHAYNLRFGPAESAEQRKVYRALYPILRGDRDRIYAALGPQATAPPAAPDPKLNPSEVFHGLDEKRLGLPPQNR